MEEGKYFLGRRKIFLWKNENISMVEGKYFHGRRKIFLWKRE